MAETPKAAVQTAETTGGTVVARGLKLAGETVAPGASLILDGNVVAGAAHLIGGMIARAALGPIGLLLVAANSYSTSVTGKSLLTHLQGGLQQPR